MVVAIIKSQNEKNSAVPNQRKEIRVAVNNTQENDAQERTLSEFINAQSKDAFCGQVCHLVGTSRSGFAIDKNGVLIRPSPKDGLWNTCHRINVSTLATKGTSFNDNRSSEWETDIWIASMRLYWTQIVVEVYNTVNNCSKCPWTDDKLKQQRRMGLSSPAGFLGSGPRDILIVLPTSKTEKQSFSIFTAWYRKLTKGISTVKLMSTQVLHILVNDWMITYGAAAINL